MQSKAKENGSAKLEYVDLVITELKLNNHFAVQLVGKSLKDLDDLMIRFRAVQLKSTAIDTPPKVGEIIAAKFSEDNQFYRARVLSLDRQGKSASLVKISWLDIRS